MLQIRLGLMAAIASFTFLGCASQQAPNSLASPSNLPTTAKSPSTVATPATPISDASNFYQNFCW